MAGTEGCKLSRQLITPCTVALALHPRRAQNWLSLLRTSFYNGSRLASIGRQGRRTREREPRITLCSAKQHLGFMSFISRIVTSVRELPFGGALGALLDHAADHIAHRRGHGPDLADADRRHGLLLRSRLSLSAPRWRGRMATSPATKLTPLTRCFG